MECKPFRDILLEHLVSNNLSYIQLQEFSSHFDKALGFQIQSIESGLVERAKEKFPMGDRRSWGKSLYGGSEAWIGLNPEQLQTTYAEFFEALSFLKPSGNELFCDLGAGYGRLGILIGLLYKNIQFLGLEIVKERAAEGERVFQELKISNASILCRTIGDYEIDKADYYFVYDFGSVVEIDAVLNQISNHLSAGPITIIARGRGVRSIIDNKHFWLSSIYQSNSNSFVIYSSKSK